MSANDRYKTREGWGQLQLARVSESALQFNRPELVDRACLSLFARHTGWELHQLRHFVAAHLGEQGVPLQLIMVRTRHRNPRTALRCVRAEAVATVLLEPSRRRG